MYLNIKKSKKNPNSSLTWMHKLSMTWCWPSVEENTVIFDFICKPFHAYNLHYKCISWPIDLENYYSSFKCLLGYEFWPIPKSHPTVSPTSNWIDCSILRVFLIIYSTTALWIHKVKENFLAGILYRNSPLCVASWTWLLN